MTMDSTKQAAELLQGLRGRSSTSSEPSLAPTVGSSSSSRNSDSPASFANDSSAASASGSSTSASAVRPKRKSKTPARYCEQDDEEEEEEEEPRITGKNKNKRGPKSRGERPAKKGKRGNPIWELDVSRFDDCVTSC